MNLLLISNVLLRDFLVLVILVVTLLDYGAGNVRSVRNAIRYLGFHIKDVRFCFCLLVSFFFSFVWILLCNRIMREQFILRIDENSFCYLITVTRRTSRILFGM